MFGQMWERFSWSIKATDSFSYGTMRKELVHCIECATAKNLFRAALNYTARRNITFVLSCRTFQVHFETR